MPPRLRAVIADDEPELRAGLARQLAAVAPQVEVVASVGNGTDALAAVDALHPDVAFLDIRMPGLGGLQVAERLQGSCAVVFVTAHDDYAVQAFEQMAVDYLLKPVTAERLRQTVNRLQRAPPDPSASATQLHGLATLLDRLAPPERLQWLRAGTEGGSTVELVPVDEVLLLRAERKYTSAFTATREHLLRIAISELEERLDPARFWRVHRSTIVAVAAIARAERDLRGRYVLTLRGRPERVVVSHRYADRFRQH